MSNTFWKGITEGFVKNLPAILTGGTIVVGIGTVAYSTWAGWKIKEVTEDETIDNKTKVKKIIVLSLPIALGAGAATGCAIAAQKENSKRIATLAVGAAGAVTLANDETKEKVLEMIDKNHKIHRSEKKNEKANIAVSTDEVIEIYDNNTGYRFKTTLSDLWFEVNRFNEELSRMIGTGDTLSISDFYARLLGDSYGCLPAHELVKFGTPLNYQMEYDRAVMLTINLGSMLDENMKPIYTMDYDYLD